MAWVAEQCDDQRSFSDVLETAKLNAPSCAGYVAQVCELAKLIGGGKGAPLVYYLDRIQKIYGENKTLGEEFEASLVGMNVSKVNKTSFLRIGLIVTNIVGDKVVDGVAKQVAKSDVERLKGKNLKDKAIEVDANFGTAIELATTAFNEGAVSEDEQDTILSKYMFRSILLFCDKQKQSNEKKVIADLTEITQLFVNKMLRAAGDAKINLGVWKHMTEAKADASASSASSEPQPSSMPKASMPTALQLNDPESVFKENGFEVDCHVKEKGVDKDVYKVISVGEDIGLQLHDVFGASSLTVSIPLEKLLTGWAVFTGKVETCLPQPAPTKDSESFVSDDLRSKVFSALFGFESQVERSLQYMLYPKGVAAAEIIDKGELKLIPLTLVTSMSTEKKGAVCVTVNKAKMYLSEPASASKVEGCEKYNYVPYWWVQDTHEEDKVNMKHVAYKPDSCISVPMLQNTRRVAKNERLYTFKPKVVKQPLQGAKRLPAESAGDAKKKGNTE